MFTVILVLVLVVPVIETSGRVPVKDVDKHVKELHMVFQINEGSIVVHSISTGLVIARSQRLHCFFTACWYILEYMVTSILCLYYICNWDLFGP